MGQHTYRKKPVEIEAYQWTRGALDDEPEWIREAIRKDPIIKGSLFMHANGQWVIQTLEGLHEVSEDDWIIRGVQGELYPCKPDIFEATYEKA